MTATSHLTKGTSNAQTDEANTQVEANRRNATGPILFCFDGSEDAASAIDSAARMLAPHAAVVLTVWERAADWVPYDPATIVTSPVSRFAAHALGLDEIACAYAHETAARGAELARSAGFRVQVRIEEGRAWRLICEVADELDAEPIVVGARGLSRVQSALLGGVSSAVIVHAHRSVLVIPADHHHAKRVT